MPAAKQTAASKASGRASKSQEDATPPRSTRPAPKSSDPQKPKPAGGSNTTVPGLTPTGQPGVFYNKAGCLVNEKGLLLSLTELDQAEERIAEKLIGGPVDTPAKLLKRIALDPRLPLGMRLDAAAKAAPYFDKRTPVAVESTQENFQLDVAAIAALPRDKRIALLDMLKSVGVDLGAK